MVFHSGQEVAGGQESGEHDNLHYRPMYDYRETDVDDLAHRWFKSIAELDPDSIEYMETERVLAAQLGMHPAVREIDAKDMNFVMGALRFIGKENPYPTNSTSIMERFQYEQWDQLAEFGRFAGRQVVRNTLDDAKSYASLRIEQERAGTDYLTGVANRRGFDLAMEQLHGITNRPARRSRDGSDLGTVSLVSVYGDANRFRWINDNLGHQVGDAAIIETAWHIQDSLPESSIVYRYGGDEFGGIIAGIADVDLDGMMRRITGQQIEKAIGAEYRQAMDAIAERVREVRQLGDRVRIAARQTELSQEEVAAGRRPHHLLYINGIVVAELRKIVTMSIGAKSGAVSSLADVEDLRLGAEEVMKANKREFQNILGAPLNLRATNDNN